MAHAWLQSGVEPVSANICAKPPTACQALAAAAHKDGLRHPAIIKVASLRRNISRDLKGLVARESKGTFSMWRGGSIYPLQEPQHRQECTCRHPLFQRSFCGGLLESQSPKQFDAVMKHPFVEAFWSHIKDDDPKLQIYWKSVL